MPLIKIEYSYRTAHMACHLAVCVALTEVTGREDLGRILPGMYPTSLTRWKGKRSPQVVNL